MGAAIAGSQTQPLTRKTPVGPIEMRIGSGMQLCTQGNTLSLPSSNCIHTH